MIYSYVNDNLCVDIPGAKAYNGAKLWVWDCNGAENQQWKFLPGTWKIESAANPGMCIDVPGDDVSNGIQLQLWECNGLSAQNWGYDGNMNTIYLASSSIDASKCLDLRGATSGSASRETAVEVWDCNGLTNQQWGFG